MHSYNCDVYIDHEGVAYQVHVTNGLEIAWERKGVAGKCTFTILQEQIDKVEFAEGDCVRVRISQRWMFKGYIFTHSRNKDGTVKFTAYDQLRYLKAKETKKFDNKSVGEIVKIIAKERGLKTGTIRDSVYKIPTLIRENTTMFDIILHAIEETTTHTGEIFILYDRFGNLTLCPLKHMHRNVIIDSSVIGDFDYESSIDKQTYNVIRLGVKSAKDGALVYVTKRDEKSIAKWGMLQYCENIDTNTFNATSTASKLLKHYNSKTKTLKIKNAMGANEVVGGAVIMVDLDLGDMKLKQNMVVDAVTHRVEDGLYSMDLELIGGEFVSTRGVQGDPNTPPKRETQGADGAPIGSGGSLDWGHGITAEQINKAFRGGILAGKGQTLIDLCNIYKINPALVAAIICLETGRGKSNAARNKYNFSGIMTGKGSMTIKKFSSIDEGLKASVSLLSRQYINKHGRYHRDNTIKGIAKIYCPPGAANDKYGTNAGWPANVSRIFREITGKNYDPSMAGTGVQSDEEANRNKQLGAANRVSSTSSVNGNKIVQIAQKYLTNGIKKPAFWWCCWFVNKCIKEAGMTPPPASNPNLCDSYYEAYQKIGKLMNPQTYTPKPGDAIFFYGSGGGNRKHTNHIGIVSHVSGSGNGIKIHTIEGNADNAVKSRTYGRSGASWARIVGYGVN